MGVLDVLSGRGKRVGGCGHVRYLVWICGAVDRVSNAR